MRPGPGKLFTVNNAIALGLMLRLGMAASNGLWGSSFAVGPDAAGFHLGAVAYASGISSDFQFSNIYIYALGTVYRWLMPSLILGNALSIAAWMASAVLLVQMMKMMELAEEQQFVAMLLFALLPSSILITSVTLREPYQLLAVHLVVYAALKIHVSKSWVYWTLLLTGAALMAALHGGLFVAGLAIAVITLLFSSINKGGPYSPFKLGLILFIPFLLTYAGWPLFMETMFNSELELGEALQARQDNIWQQLARAHYSTGIKIRSDADLLLFVPVALFQYMFQPFPWRISALIDWALVLENSLRFFLLYKVVIALYYLPMQGKKRVAFVSAAYLVIETMWAVGTINWGTAARHHIPAFGLLLLGAFSCPRKLR